MSILPPAVTAVYHSVLTQAHLSVQDLARQLGLQSHTVRRAIETLKSRKILLGIRPYVNPSLLGINEYYLYFSLQIPNSSSKDAFVMALCRHEQVSYVAEVGGDYQYEVRFMAHDSTDLVNFLDDLSDKFQSKVIIMSLCLIHAEEYSAMTEGSWKSADNVPYLSFAASDRRVAIDELDHKILSLFANDGVDSAPQIARVLGVPTSTVIYRLNKMRSSGLISGYFYLSDSRPFGLLPVILLVGASSFTKKQRERFLKHCRLHGQIAVTNITTGPWQARLLARVKEYKDILRLVRTLSEEFAENIQTIRVLPQLEFHKALLYPFRNFKTIQTRVRAPNSP